MHAIYKHISIYIYGIKKMFISKRFAGQYRIIGELKLQEKTIKITYEPKSKISSLVWKSV